MKGSKQGLTRLINAARYSWQGIRSTWATEAAFREELPLVLILIPVALWLDVSGVEKALLITECSMASNIADELPEVEFVGPCNMCPYMKKITLEKVLWSLHSMEGQVEVEAEMAAKARHAVQAMIDLSRKLGI